MPVPAATNVKLPLDSRIHAWIDAIAPGPPSTSKPRKPTDQNDDNPRPAKRTRRKVLELTAGNIMQPTGKGKEVPKQELRRSPRNLSPIQPANGGNRAGATSGGAANGHPSRTRRGRHAGLGVVPKLAPPAPHIAELSSEDSGESSDDGVDLPELDAPRTLTRTSSPSKEGSSRRSQSPVKRIDLEMAERSVHFDTLDGESARKAGGFLAQYAALLSFSRGVGVIPSSLKKAVEDYTDPDDKPPEHCYSGKLNRTYDEGVWEKIMEIHNSGSECLKTEGDEGNWNEKVHGPLLNLVVKDPKFEGAIETVNVTLARIGPKELNIKNLNGVVMGGKKVDFVVGLRPGEALKKKIREQLALHPKDSQSLNQTTKASIRNVIIYLNVETKPPSAGGPHSDVQLAVWGYAGFTKLHQLLETAGHGGEVLPIIPLLSIHGHIWELSAMRETGDENRVLEKLLLGSTAKIEGIFQIVQAIDLLVHWGNTEYRQWYFANVLGIT